MKERGMSTVGLQAALEDAVGKTTRSNIPTKWILHSAWVETGGITGPQYWVELSRSTERMPPDEDLHGPTGAIEA
jgi:hypothetical protein